MTTCSGTVVLHFHVPVVVNEFVVIPVPGNHLIINATGTHATLSGTADEGGYGNWSVCGWLRRLLRINGRGIRYNRSTTVVVIKASLINSAKLFSRGWHYYPKLHCTTTPDHRVDESNLIGIRRTMVMILIGKTLQCH